MYRQCATLALCIVGFVGISTQPVTADQPAPTEVKAWLEEQWKAAPRLPNLNGHSIRWRTEDPLPSASEVADLRRQVEGHPEHPRRDELRRAESALKIGRPAAMQFQLFARDEHSWRFNSTYGTGVFTDEVLTPSTAWRLSNAAVMLLDRSHVGRDAAQEMESERFVFLPMVGSVLWGSIERAATSRLVPGDVSISGNRWKVLARRTTGSRLVLEYEGRWDPDAKRGFVETYRIAQNPALPSSEGEGERFLDWAYFEGVGVWAAKRIELFRSNGSTWRTIHLEGFDPLPAGGFETVFKEPGAGGNDVIRGPIARTIPVADYKANEVRQATESGQTLTSPIPRAAPAAVASARNWLGWLMIAGVAGVATVILTRRWWSAGTS